MMTAVIQKKRLQYEEENLIDNANQLPPNCSYKKMSDLAYVVQYIGEKGTPFEGAYIVVDIDLSDSNGSLGFPEQCPKITFRNNFQHLNVDSNGKLHTDIINKETFNNGTTLLEIFIQINYIIYHPSYVEPINKNLLEIKVLGFDFDDWMQGQSMKLRDLKYKVL
ncbi:unnamed protein product [Paramecium pentaurelia]|uniref:UBC core domain-containing protein n=1 Tax=Paramecium pentaurelia TaxID=43138 RepID=A0A8S1Y8G1_9CILI|nr:unnamed protein product [Paramecium pentaurelia]